MLDWAAIGINVFWILGLALCLAALSYADWWAHHHQVPRRQAWSTSMFLSPFSVGVALVGVSLALTARSAGARALWAAWSLFLIAQSVVVWRRADERNDDG